MEREILIKSAEEIEIMAQGGKILSQIFAELQEATKPGITKKALDDLAREKIQQTGVQPAFLGFRGFPAVLCVCLNQELVHSIPDNTQIKLGDIVSLDLGIKYQGFCIDKAMTFAVGRVSEKSQKLIQTGQVALTAGIKKIKPGNKISDVQKAISQTIKQAGFFVIQGLTGHGIGRDLQEFPPIPNEPDGKDFILKPGMTLALEPMLGTETGKIKVAQDGWTVSVAQGLSSHFEHTVAVVEDGYRILT